MAATFHPCDSLTSNVRGSLPTPTSESRATLDPPQGKRYPYGLAVDFAKAGQRGYLTSKNHHRESGASVIVSDVDGAAFVNLDTGHAVSLRNAQMSGLQFWPLEFGESFRLPCRMES